MPWILILSKFASSNPSKTLNGYSSDDESYTLEFLVDPSDTKMFSPLEDDAHIFEDLAITYNHHNWGVDPNKFKTDQGLGSMFRPTSISYDNN